MPDQLTTSRKRVWTSAILAVVLAASLGLRLTGIDWDGLYHLHPDERYIVWVGTTVEYPADWRIGLNPATSTFNPFYWPPDAESEGIRVQQGEARSFAYGHWPLYLAVAAQHLLDSGAGIGASLPASWDLIRSLLNAAEIIEYRHLLLVGRALAAVADTITVLLAFLLGRRLYGNLAGLLAATFAASAVLHIQSAHFFITDPFLAMAVMAALFWMVRRAQDGHLVDGIVAGGLVGLAVGAKFSAIILVLPLVASVAWSRRVPPVALGSSTARRISRRWQWFRRPAVEFSLALVAAVLVFVLTNPFAVLDNTCEGRVGPLSVPLVDLAVGPLTVHSCYLKNIGTQSRMVQGNDLVPFTLQYKNTPAYTYYLDQMARWGLGIPLTLLGFVGLLWAAARLAIHRSRLPGGELVVLAWAVPFFVVTGSFQVKFLRYLLPLTPVLAVYAAGLLVTWRSAKGWAAVLGRWGIPLTLIYGLLWSWQFMGIYRADHPWVAASRWILTNVPTESTLATEHWDHALPLDLRLEDRTSDSGSGTYSSAKLEWYSVEDRLQSGSSVVDLREAAEQLARSDYLILASNRLYGVIPRLPERFPEGSAFYRLLFGGQLGFDLVHWDRRSMGLGSIYVLDDPFEWPGLEAPGTWPFGDPSAMTVNWGPADESFTVYDHPLVLIFENTGEWSADALVAAIRMAAASGGG